MAVKGMWTWPPAPLEPPVVLPDPGCDVGAAGLLAPPVAAGVAGDWTPGVAGRGSDGVATGRPGDTATLTGGDTGFGVGSGKGTGSAIKATATRRTDHVPAVISKFTPAGASVSRLSSAHYQHPGGAIPVSSADIPLKRVYAANSGWGHGTRPGRAQRFHATRHPAALLCG